MHGLVLAFRLIVTGVIALAVVGLSARDATATTVLEVDVPEMTRLSRWIVKAQVTDVSFADLRAEGGRIFTDVTLAIDEVYKGQDVPSVYVLRLIGGRGDDGMALTVPGMPRFTEGERVVLFLEQTQQGYVPCGLGQGVWRLARDAHGVTWLQQSSFGLHMMTRSPSGRLIGAAPPTLCLAVRLDELIAQIYAAQLDEAKTPD